MRFHLLFVFLLLPFLTESSVSGDDKATLSVTIGMKQNKAEQILHDAKVARTKDYGVGYITREKLSDPLPPREQLYAVDTQTRLDIYIERDSYTITKMILRISPDFEKERNPRYFPEYIYLNCQGVTFHGDGTYSVRFGPRELKADANAEVRGYPYP